MITEEQAQELIRLLCCALGALGGLALAVAGLVSILRPNGRRTRHTAPILYFLRSKDGLRCPVVNLGTADAPVPVTVRTPGAYRQMQPGDALEIALRPGHPEDVAAAVPRSAMPGVLGMVAGGVMIYVCVMLLRLALPAWSLMG